MKLWKISQTTNNYYDTYDSAIVAAETEEEARYIRPDEEPWPSSGTRDWSWVKPEEVIVEYLGTTERDIVGVIVASFNAG